MKMKHDAAPDVLAAHLDGLGLDALLGKDLLHFLQGDGCIAPYPGAAVDDENVHGLHLFFRICSESGMENRLRAC